MTPPLPAEVERFLTKETSHLIVPAVTTEACAKLGDYLRSKGIVISNEVHFKGGDGQPWLLLSLAQAHTGALVLELIGLGFPQRITGIDAKPAGGAG